MFGAYAYGGFPKLGVPIIRTIVFWGLYWGPPILGNYHILQDWHCAHTGFGGLARQAAHEPLRSIKP